MFEKANWINNTTIYEVNIRQYTKDGTLNAFAEHLPRLKSMGIDTLWFMPLTPISQKNKKGTLGSYYACSDYVSINQEFGTAQDFKNLIKLAHSLHFKIMIDWVANHTGWDHHWTVEHPDFYLWDNTTHNFQIASGMDDIIQLNYENPNLRKAMIDAMQYWVTEFDIDGFRCDLAFWVTVDFWYQARTQLQKIKTLFWLGEFETLDHPEYFPAFDAAYTWTWMGKMEDFKKGNFNFADILLLLKKYNDACGNEKIPLWFTTNHDENSWNGTEFEKYGDMAKALAVFCFTWNGLAMLYSGQELPNTKRLAFFDKDCIEWNGNYAYQDFYKILTTLKNTNPALLAANKNVSTHLIKLTATNNCLCFLRKNITSQVFVCINFSETENEIELKDELLNTNYINVFDGSEMLLNLNTCFTLKPWSYLVLEG